MHGTKMCPGYRLDKTNVLRCSKTAIVKSPTTGSVRCIVMFSSNRWFFSSPVALYVGIYCSLYNSKNAIYESFSE